MKINLLTTEAKSTSWPQLLNTIKETESVKQWQLAALFEIVVTTQHLDYLKDIKNYLHNKLNYYEYYDPYGVAPVFWHTQKEARLYHQHTKKLLNAMKFATHLDDEQTVLRKNIAGLGLLLATRFKNPHDAYEYSYNAKACFDLLYSSYTGVIIIDHGNSAALKILSELINATICDSRGNNVLQHVTYFIIGLRLTNYNANVHNNNTNELKLYNTLDNLNNINSGSQMVIPEKLQSLMHKIPAVIKQQNLCILAKLLKNSKFIPAPLLKTMHWQAFQCLSVLAGNLLLSDLNQPQCPLLLFNIVLEYLTGMRLHEKKLRELSSCVNNPSKKSSIQIFIPKLTFSLGLAYLGYTIPHAITNFSYKNIVATAFLSIVITRLVRQTQSLYLIVKTIPATIWNKTFANTLPSVLVADDADIYHEYPKLQ